MKKEIRIGLLTISALFVFVAGFYFLKGSNLFSSEHDYIAYFDNVQGLTPSSQVLVRGMVVGRVEAIQLTEDNQVEVRFAVKKDIHVGEGTVAVLASTDLLGTKALSLTLNTSNPALAANSVLPSDVEGGLIDAISTELNPLIQDIRHAVASLDTILVSVHKVLDGESQQHLKQGIANLNATMSHLNAFSSKLDQESEQLAGVIRNANTVTGTLANNTQKLDNILTNVEKTTDELAKAPISTTVQQLESTIGELSGILQKINKNEGSLGLLVHDKALYNNLTSSLQTLSTLMADIEANPSRYINVTIFGRKNK